MNRIVSVIIIFCTVLSSCKKEEAQTQKPVTNGSLISFVLLGEEPIKEITYTSDSSIYELIEPNSYKKYTYNSEHQLERIDQSISISPFSCAMGGGTVRTGDDPRKSPVTQYFTYEYNDGKIAKQSTFYFINSKATLVQNITYHYESEKELRINMCNPDGKLMYFDKYTIDDNGNLSRKEHYIVESNSNTRLISALEYLYDTKNNPYQIFACEGIPGINTNKNNITKETLIYYNQGVETRSSIETMYEYNSFDFPSTAGSLSFLYVDPTKK